MILEAALQFEITDLKFMGSVINYFKEVRVYKIWKKGQRGKGFINGK